MRFSLLSCEFSNARFYSSSTSWIFSAAFKTKNYYFGESYSKNLFNWWEEIVGLSDNSCSRLSGFLSIQLKMNLKSFFS